MQRLSTCVGVLLLNLLAPSFERTFAKDVPYADARVPNILESTKVGDWAIFEYQSTVDGSKTANHDIRREELWVVESFAGDVILFRCKSPIMGEYYLQRRVPTGTDVHPHYLVSWYSWQDYGSLKSKPVKPLPSYGSSDPPHPKEKEDLAKTKVDTKGSETQYRYDFELKMEKFGKDKCQIEMKMSGTSFSGLALLKIVRTKPNYTGGPPRTETTQRKLISSGSAGSTPPEPKALDSAAERKAILTRNPFEKALAGTLTFDVTKRSVNPTQSTPGVNPINAIFDLTLGADRKLTYKQTGGDKITPRDQYLVELPDEPGVLCRPFLWAGKLIPMITGSTHGGLPMASASQTAVKVKIKGESFDGIQIKMRFAKGDSFNEYDITFIPDGPTGIYAMKQKVQTLKGSWEEIEFKLAK